MWAIKTEIEIRVQCISLSNIAVLYSLSVADPGFPRGGGTNPKGGAPTYYLANFSRKLHENEEILGRGGRASLVPPLRSATVFIVVL